MSYQLPVIPKLELIPILLAACLFACSPRADYERPSIVSSPNAVNINTATVDELERLPHIGPKTAESIVLFRTENGRFRRVEHVMLIRGISEKRFLEIRPFITAE